MEEAIYIYMWVRGDGYLVVEIYEENGSRNKVTSFSKGIVRRA